MRNQLTALVAYFAVMAVSLQVVTGLTALIARDAVANFEITALQAKPRLSRVERGLIRQARAASRRVKHPPELLADPAPDISAFALARAMDAAEDVAVPETSEENLPHWGGQVPGARVAGWLRRDRGPATERHAGGEGRPESTARIIERNLKSNI